MRISSIEIQSFRRISRARLDLGPGLNVLHGPNDLGKSTIADALRAAFLVQHGSSEARSYVPWTSGRVPSVRVVFESGGAMYRITKTFGAGRSGSTLLEGSAGPGLFVKMADARAADDKLRTILAWGLPALGGRGRPKNDSFLTVALLARQGDVAGILGTSLAADGADSGKALITNALGAMAQDPLVARLIERLEARIGQVYSEKGRLRRAEASPLVALASAIKAKEAQLAQLETDREESERIALDVRTHRERRDELLIAAEAVKDRFVSLRRSSELWKARAVLEAEIARLHVELKRIGGNEEEVGRGEALLGERHAAMEAAHARTREAREAVSAGEARLGAARKRHEAATLALESARAVADEAREKRRIELLARIAEDDRKLAAVAATERAKARAAELERELESARSEVSRLEVEAASASAQAEVAAVCGALHAAEAKAAAAAEAKSDLDVAALAVERAARERAAKEARQREALAAFERARGAHEQAVHGASRRAAEIQSARTRLLELEGEQQQATAWLERALSIETKTSALWRLEQDLSEKQSSLEAIAMEIASSDRRIAAARVAIVAIESALLNRDASDKRARADRLAAEWEEQEALRAKWQAARAQAQAAREESEARVMITPTAVAGFRTIERALDEERKPIHTSSSVPLALPAVGALAAGVICVLAASPMIDGPAVPEVLGLIVAAIAFVAISFSQKRAAMRKADDEAADRRAVLEQRWSVEVAPILREAGVPDVDGLEAYRVASEQLGRDAAKLRDESDALEVELGGLRLHKTEVDAARSEAAEAARRIAGIAPAGAQGAEGNAAIGPAQLDQARRDKEDAESDRAHQIDSRNALQPAIHGLEAQLRGMKEDVAQARAGFEGDPVHDRAAWEERRNSALHARRETEASIDGIEKETLGDAQALESAFNARKKELDEAAAMLRSAEDARSTAREVAAERRARWESFAKAARESGVDALKARLRELRDQHADQVPQAGEPIATTGAARAAAEAARAALEDARQKVRADGALAGRAAEDAQQVERELGAPAEEIKARVAEDRELATKDLEALDAGQAEQIARLEVGQRDAANGLGTAADAHEKAKERLSMAEADEARTVGEIERITGELTVSRRALEGADKARLLDAIGIATRKRDEIPACEDVAESALADAEAACTKQEDELARAEQALHSAQGKLQLLGGAAIAEKCADEREAIDRLRARAQDLEEEVDAQRLLLTTLKEKEKARASNLGAVLARPITERFAALAGNRYGRVQIDSGLRAETIEAGGESRSFDLLSVGTREQLATLVRLAVATQLKTAVALDDQLVHSDPGRMGWFRDELRRCAAGGTQIVVLTCRPDDYLDGQAEPPDGVVPGASDETVAIDLAQQLSETGSDA